MIRLAKPNITKNAINDVVDILKSGNLVQGYQVAKFEKDLADYLNVKEAIMVSNGTAALHLSLLALDIKSSDEVIVPAFTYIATVNSVEFIGAKPVFVDINLNDFCIDTSQIESVITKKTTAIMVVHEFGQPANMSEVKKICDKYKLKLVEDAACALGSKYNDKMIGSIGQLGCFSFHPRKAITTGEGGAVITNDKNLAKKVRALRNHGIEYNSNKPEFNYAGFNYRMTEFQAVLGIHQLTNFNKEINSRNKLAKRYSDLLKDLDWLTTPCKFKNRKTIFQSYHILLSEELNRDNFINYLQKNNIQANLGAQAVHIQKYYKNKYNFPEDKYPNASFAYKNGVVLPIGSYLDYKDIKFICDTIKKYVK